MSIDREALGQSLFGALVVLASVAVGNPWLATVAQGAGVNLATDALPALWRGLRAPKPGTALARAYGDAFRSAVTALEKRHGRADPAFALLREYATGMGSVLALPEPGEAQRAAGDALKELLRGDDAWVVEFIRRELPGEMARAFTAELERNETARGMYVTMLMERIAAETATLGIAVTEMARIVTALGDVPAQLAGIREALARLEADGSGVAQRPSHYRDSIHQRGHDATARLENEGSFADEPLPPDGVNSYVRSIRQEGDRSEATLINRATPPDTRTTILAFFADPAPRTEPLDLMAEQRALQQAIEAFPDDFRIVVAPSATIEGLEAALLKHEPSVLHLAGHGTAIGFRFDDGSGEEEVVRWAHLAETLRAQRPPLRVVVLSACHGVEALGALRVPWLVAMPGALYDAASIAFARGFYQSLSAKPEAISAAYDAGQRATRRRGFADDELPRLFKDGTMLS